jgi:hypothetical protein
MDDRHDTVMSLLAIWYYHSPEGLRFIEARDIRMMLAAAGVLAAYIMMRIRPRHSHQETRWWKFVRFFTGATVASLLWLGVDWVRGEDWILQLIEALPDLHENGIRYSLVILAGWFGWSIAVFEALRWIAIVRQLPHRSQSGS